MKAQSWVEFGFLIAFITLFMMLDMSVEMSWTHKHCGHRDSGSLHEFLNPFRRCQVCGRMF